MQDDGLSLDDKRQPIEKNDLPDIVSRFHNLKEEFERKRTDKSFLVPVQEIRDTKYDLSINRYKEVVHEEIIYEKPQVIIDQIRELDRQRAELMAQLKNLLS
jgi:type I restriction enzyme M protein